MSVVIPARDRPELLRQALASVAAQQHPPAEVIVVDDGSLPALEPPAGVTVRRHPAPRGAAAARNSGLERVRTKWVAFLDDDDLWAPAKLSSQLRALTADSGARWCYTGALLVDEGLNLLGVQRARLSGEIEGRLLGGNVIAGGGSSVLVAADLVRQAGGFDEALSAGEDWDCWVRLARLSPVLALDAPLAASRHHVASKSRHWRRESLDVLETKLGRRARELGVSFRHTYPSQLRIEECLRRRDGRGAARVYWERFRSEGTVRDAMSAGAALGAPRVFDRVRSWESRSRIPLSWRAGAGWVERCAAAGAAAGPER